MLKKSVSLTMLKDVMMKFIFKFLMLNLFIVFFTISYAQSGVVESKFVEVLEGVCLLNKDDFSHIDKMAVALKLKPVPDEFLQGDAVIAARGGKGYIIEEAEQKFIIGYAVDGGCSVVTSLINLNELKRKLLSVYKLKLVKTDDEGMQVTEFYRFEPDSFYVGDYLIITHRRKYEENDLVSVGYLPKKIYLKEINQSPQNCITQNINVCELAKESAKKMNAELPKTLGNITYMSVIADGKQIVHNYTVNYGLQEAAKLTNFTTEEIRNNQRRMVNQMVCGDNSVRLLLNSGISIIYIYKFKDGAINEIVVSSCKGH